jgi:ABC-type glycerol-3-phosphate transport system permease component
MYIGTSVFGMLIFTGAWKGIAWDYAEAAKIDGANHVTILLKIMIPQVSGVWATLFLMDFITFWNDSSTPMMYFPNMPTLAQGLYEYEEQTTRAINMPLYFSGLMMSMVPILILFFCFSNLIMEKVYIGGLKG